jgi:hypothetical protein
VMYLINSVGRNEEDKGQNEKSTKTLPPK